MFFCQEGNDDFSVVVAVRISYLRILSIYFTICFIRVKIPKTIWRNTFEIRIKMIYVTADIHRNTERYCAAMSKIKLKPEYNTHIIGDVVDIHPDGIELLHGITEAENNIILLVNHEYIILNVLRPSPEAGVFEK